MLSYFNYSILLVDFFQRGLIWLCDAKVAHKFCLVVAAHVHGLHNAHQLLLFLPRHPLLVVEAIVATCSSQLGLALLICRFLRLFCALFLLGGCCRQAEHGLESLQSIILNLLEELFVVELSV